MKMVGAIHVVPGVMAQSLADNPCPMLVAETVGK